MQNQKTQYKFNIVLLGKGTVGKSSLVQRFDSNQFTLEYTQTLQDTFRKNIIVDGNLVQLEITDTAGQEDYSQLQQMWIEKGDGFILCFSTIWMESFAEINQLKKSIMEIKNPYKPCIQVVGTKTDLVDQRKVEKFVAVDYCKREGFNYIETSSKTGENCSEAFLQLIRSLINQKQGIIQNPKENEKDLTFFEKFCTLI